MKTFFTFYLFLIVNLFFTQSADKQTEQKETNLMRCNSDTIFTNILNMLDNEDVMQAQAMLKQVEEHECQILSDTNLFLYHLCKSGVHQLLNENEKAIERLLLAKIICDEKLGVVNGGYLQIMQAIAFLESELGNKDNAIKYLQEGLVKGELISGELVFGEMLGDLAQLYDEKGDTIIVEGLYKDAYNIVSQYYEERDYESYQYLMSLAIHFSQYDKWRESIELCNKIIPFIESENNKELKEITSHSILSLNAYNYEMIEDYEKALFYGKKLSPIKENRYGQKSEEYGMHCNTLFVYCLKTGDLIDAEKYLTTASTVLLPLFGNESDIHSLLLHNKGKLLLDQKQFVESVDVLSKAIELQEKLFGEANVRTLECFEEAKRNLK